VIAIIDYGAGNIRSIGNGLKKAGAKAEIVSDPRMLETADAIVLPGVGSFGDAMDKLARFKPAIVEAVESGKPFLGLCLGEQVIFESSEESPGTEGLGLFKGGCRRFKGQLKVPHMGWNTITLAKDTPLLAGIEGGEYFYFVHSYYVVPNDKGVIAAETDYGVRFPSVVSSGSVYACQFHPEKSGDRGLEILRNFIGLTRK
jgi:imidazole glycerol-phosphate synthase subunit HisH